MDDRDAAVPLDPGRLTDMLRHAWDAYVGPADELVVSAAGPFPGDVAAGVAVSGGWEGWVELACSGPLARRIAGGMLAVPTSEVTAQDESESLAELVNVVGGAVKAVLAQAGTLSLPFPSTGAGRPAGSADGLRRSPASTLVLLRGRDDEAITVAVHPGAPESRSPLPAPVPHRSQTQEIP